MGNSHGPQVRHLVRGGRLECRYRTKVTPLKDEWPGPGIMQCPKCYRPITRRWRTQDWEAARARMLEVGAEAEDRRAARTRERTIARALERRRFVAGRIEEESMKHENGTGENVWGPYLRRLRRRLGRLSQERMAERLCVSVSTLRKWEQGRNVPSPLAHRRIRAVAKEARAEAEAAKRGVARVAAQEEA